MNQLEAEVIAAAVAIIRPDWKEASMVTLLAKHRHRPARQVALALVAMAYDPDVQTPGLLNSEGGAAFFAVAAPLEPTYVAPALTERLCPSHGDRQPCRGCAADRKAAATEAELEPAPERMPGESLIAWAARMADGGRP